MAQFFDFTGGHFELFEVLEAGKVVQIQTLQYHTIFIDDFSSENPDHFSEQWGSAMYQKIFCEFFLSISLKFIKKH